MLYCFTSGINFSTQHCGLFISPIVLQNYFQDQVNDIAQAFLLVLLISDIHLNVNVNALQSQKHELKYLQIPSNLTQKLHRSVRLAATVSTALGICEHKCSPWLCRHSRCHFGLILLHKIVPQCIVVFSDTDDREMSPASAWP